ncbi:hypothetical protein [Oceanithermus sp.]|uniref:hypothetical protein n=1 Tax=Oceanithermus sp. TaxID=2268145 RepID=UPI00257A2B24|nr:hypothetical protein [Oceanithermus sp.]
MTPLDFLYLWFLYWLAFFVPIALVFGAKTLFDLVAVLRRKAARFRKVSLDFDPLGDFQRPAGETGGRR